MNARLLEKFNTYERNYFVRKSLTSWSVLGRWWWRRAASNPFWYHRITSNFCQFILWALVVMWTYSIWFASLGLISQTLRSTLAQEAFHVENVSWPGVDERTQLTIMAQRTEMEQFGRDFINLDLSAESVMGATFINSKVTYFDDEIVLRSWTEMLNVFTGNSKSYHEFCQKFSKLDITKLRIIHHRDRIIFRFQRELTPQSNPKKIERENSLLVLYLT